jgi:hypothetical protein
LTRRRRNQPPRNRTACLQAVLSFADSRLNLVVVIPVRAAALSTIVIVVVIAIAVTTLPLWPIPATAGRRAEPTSETRLTKARRTESRASSTWTTSAWSAKAGTEARAPKARSKSGAPGILSVAVAALSVRSFAAGTRRRAETSPKTGRPKARAAKARTKSRSPDILPFARAPGRISFTIAAALPFHRGAAAPAASPCWRTGGSAAKRASKAWLRAADRTVSLYFALKGTNPPLKLVDAFFQSAAGASAAFVARRASGPSSSRRIAIPFAWTSIRPSLPFATRSAPIAFLTLWPAGPLAAGRAVQLGKQSVETIAAECRCGGRRIVRLEQDRHSQCRTRQREGLEPPPARFQPSFHRFLL